MLKKKTVMHAETVRRAKPVVPQAQRVTRLTVASAETFDWFDWRATGMTPPVTQTSTHFNLG